MGKVNTNTVDSYVKYLMIGKIFILSPFTGSLLKSKKNLGRFVVCNHFSRLLKYKNSKLKCSIMYTTTN